MRPDISWGKEWEVNGHLLQTEIRRCAVCTYRNTWFNRVHMVQLWFALEFIAWKNDQLSLDERFLALYSGA